MRKYLVTLFLMCVAVSAFAVDLPKQGFGVQIGWAQPILRLNDPSNQSTAKDSLSNVTKLKGFKVGIVYDGSFIAGFGTSIGINYTFGATSTAWTKKFPNQPTLYPQVHDKVLYHELELFVDWQYKFEVAKETYLMLYTGPTIQCGVGFYSQRDERSIDGTLIPAIAASDRYIFNTEFFVRAGGIFFNFVALNKIRAERQISNFFCVAVRTQLFFNDR